MSKPQRRHDDPDRVQARKDTRAVLVSRLFVVVGIALLVAVLYVLIRVSSDTNTIVTKVSDRQNTNAPLLESIENLALQIRSCTDPEGVCAKRGRDATGSAIASINQYGLYVVTCADQPGQQTEVEIRECADRLQTLAARKP